MTNIRVLIADDDCLVRACLVVLINGFDGVEVIAEANDGREAVGLVAEWRPDVVLMDVSMAELNGVDATEQIIKCHPSTRVVMLSGHSTEQNVLRSLHSGAVGYLLKKSAPEELERALRSVARGEIYLSPAISNHVLNALSMRKEADATPLETLTPRHREILQLVAEGKTTKEISTLLGATPKTIESHRSTLMSRLDIHEVAGLVRFAIRNGLVSADT